MTTLLLPAPAVTSPPRLSAPASSYGEAKELRWAVRHWASRLDVPMPSLSIRPMSRKWASISTSGRLTMNTEVVTLPRDLADFVIVHELVHLIAPNHGRVFKTFMSVYLPDWQEREARLREMEERERKG